MSGLSSIICCILESINLLNIYQKIIKISHVTKGLNYAKDMKSWWLFYKMQVILKRKKIGLSKKERKNNTTKEWKKNFMIKKIIKDMQKLK